MIRPIHRRLLVSQQQTGPCDRGVVVALSSTAYVGLRHSRAWVQITVATLSGNSLRQTVHTHRAFVHKAATIGSSPLKVCGGNCRPGEKQWQPTAGFMTHVTCRLTTKNRDQLRNPTLDNRVWASFTFLT